MVYLPDEFRTQFAAQDWLRKYCSNEQTAKGRAALIDFAEDENIPTSTLVDIVNAPCKGPMQGLATSVLVQREILGTYKGPIRLDAPWAGSYVTVNKDDWGSLVLFSGDHVLTGAKITGDSIMRDAVVEGTQALDSAILIGPRAGYKLRVAGDHSCQGLKVQGYQAGMNMRISGRGAGAAAYFKGTSAGCNASFGDKSGRGVTFDGLGAGRNIKFDNLRERRYLRYINNE